MYQSTDETASGEDSEASQKDEEISADEEGDAASAGGFSVSNQPAEKGQIRRHRPSSAPYLRWRPAYRRTKVIPSFHSTSNGLSADHCDRCLIGK